MKTKLLPLTVAISLLLASCGGPETAAEPTPALEPGPSADVLAMLDAGFSEGELELECIISPAAVLCTLPLNEADYGTQVRALFQGLDWKEAGRLQEGTGYQACLRYGEGALFLSAGSEAVWTSDGKVFRAEGGGDLCHGLMELWPGPELRYVQMPGVEFGTGWQECAERFLSAFGAYYLDSGAVTDFDPQGVLVLNGGEDKSELVLRVAYAVRPARAELQYWKDRGSDEDGWIKLRDDIVLSRDETGFWRCTALGN